MSVSRPATRVSLEWRDALRFAGTAGGHTLALDGDGGAGPSPVQALVLALAGCMATDVVHILTRGRLPLRRLRAELSAERAEEEPRRLTAVSLHFSLEGEVPADKVERAISLSREKYCSVWHSLRPDIEFRTSFEVR